MNNFRTAATPAPPLEMDAHDRALMIQVLRDREIEVGTPSEGEVVAISRAVRSALTQLIGNNADIVEQYGPEVALRCQQLAWLAAAKGEALRSLLDCIADVNNGRETNGAFTYLPEARHKISVVYTGRARLSALVGVSIAS